MSIKVAMVIDDSDEDQFIAKMELEEFDETIKILQAYDGCEALEILSSLDVQPDVIFLDVNMPRMNGLEFLEEYNNMPSQAKVVVMLTSSDYSKDKDTAMKYSFVKDYFLKSINVDDIKKIAQML